ncbi:GntR family transcriptional regulator [Streptomyces sp. NPDC057580]|uniref:GntR family transcriptional regulator n=1 Tax=Streptomyces sp. NPDC057580 TaxID=3346173 RepID=UPI0036987DBF
MKIGERLARILRDEIIAGHHAPDEPMRIAALARRLGASTTPVREALAILEGQGLLNGRPHRGYRVREFTPDDIEHVYQVHAFMVRTLTERATLLLSDAELDGLDRLDQEMRAATEASLTARAADLNHELHRRVHLASGSQLLLQLMRGTTPFVTRRDDPDVPGWADQRLEGHKAILDAMRARDAALAGELMAGHLLQSGRHAVSFAQESQAAVPPDAMEGCR